MTLNHFTNNPSEWKYVLTIFLSFPLPPPRPVHPHRSLKNLTHLNTKLFKPLDQLCVQSAIDFFASSLCIHQPCEKYVCCCHPHARSHTCKHGYHVAPVITTATICVPFPGATPLTFPGAIPGIFSGMFLVRFLVYFLVYSSCNSWNTSWYR